MSPYFPVFSTNKRKYGPKKYPYLYTFHGVNFTPTSSVSIEASEQINGK